MQFLYPTFLFALAALAIPIIIHLFHFRRFKKVYFTNVRFLKEVKEETSARSKIRNLLVLIARLLALTFLILAFAQPFIPQTTEVQQGRKNVSLYIDNSFSMSALSRDVPLYETAKQRAREIIQAYSEQDRFQIITNDFSGRQQRLVSKEDALALVDEIENSPDVRQISKVVDRQQRALEREEASTQVAYLISDFQKTTTDLSQLTDTTLNINLVPLAAISERNVSIDSVWFEAPVQMLNQNNPLVVKLRNLSDEPMENIRLSIRYDGQTKPVGTLTIPPFSTITDTVNISIFQTGWNQATLNITDYPIQFDDKYNFSFFVAESIKVLTINQELPNRFMAAAFGGIPYFEVDDRQVQNLDYSQFGNYQMIVLSDVQTISSGLASELRSFAENGGNVLVFPPKTADLTTYRSFLGSIPANQLGNFEDKERQVVQINTSEFVFKDVFQNSSANLKLPISQGNFTSPRTGANEEPLLIYRDGSSYMSKYKLGDGNLYICLSPLDETINDLVKNGEIFIPMLYKMAISASRTQQIAYTIGSDEVIEQRHDNTGQDLVYKIKNEESGEFIPEQVTIGSNIFFTIGEQIKQAGFYNWFLNVTEPLGTIAFNYDRKESELSYFTKDELGSITNPKIDVIDINDSAVLTTLIEERSQGIVLWRLCLILALVFLAVEILLLRFWKV
ncbi:MAG: BatA domain-containing protein [Bacteroidota bacterium]